MSSRVVVLGGTGMLGNTLLASLVAQGFDVIATARRLDDLPIPFEGERRRYDAAIDSLADVLGDLGSSDYLVNCIGLIKHNMDETRADDRRAAIAINSEMPYQLAEQSLRLGFRVIQIATDCVYSGRDGAYDEASLHDATDVYGQSKSLGEVPQEGFLNLRCSIIGPELSARKSLLEWVLSHEEGSSFSGYLDHHWNGVTTAAFGRVVGGIVGEGSTLSGTHHLVPADRVDKDQLSRLILDAHGRTGVEVIPTITGSPIDRTLATLSPEINSHLWEAAGYPHPPTIDRMVRELVETAPSLPYLGATP